MAFPDDGSSLTKLDPKDEAAIRRLANQLHALVIATPEACLTIASEMFDAGCHSLEYLADDFSIESIDELKGVMVGTLKNVQLSVLHLKKIVCWIQNRRQGLAPEQNAGNKRPHPSAAPPSPAAQQPRLPDPEPAEVQVKDGIALQNVGAVAEGEGGIELAGDEEDESARKFMEIMCVARAAVWRSVVHIDDQMLQGVAIMKKLYVA